MVINGFLLLNDKTSLVTEDAADVYDQTTEISKKMPVNFLTDWHYIL